MKPEYTTSKISANAPEMKCDYCSSGMHSSAEFVVNRIKKPVPSGATDLNISLREEQYILVTWTCSKCGQKLQQRHEVRYCSCGSRTGPIWTKLPYLASLVPISFSESDSVTGPNGSTSYRCTDCVTCQNCSTPISNEIYIKVDSSEYQLASTNSRYTYFHLSCAGPNNTIVQKWIEADRARVEAEDKARDEKNREYRAQELGIGVRPGYCQRCRKPLSLLDKWSGRTKHNQCP